MLGVTRDMVIFKDQFDDAFDSIRNTEQDIATAKDSFQAIYDTQKQMIEMNLGAELEEQAQKFNSLSDAEQVRFKEALESVFNLNKELDMLPAENKWMSSCCIKMLVLKFLKNIVIL
jgi:hypothetical protein